MSKRPREAAFDSGDEATSDEEEKRAPVTRHSGGSSSAATEHAVNPAVATARPPSRSLRASPSTRSRAEASTSAALADGRGEEAERSSSRRAGGASAADAAAARASPVAPARSPSRSRRMSPARGFCCHGGHVVAAAVWQTAAAQPVLRAHGARPCTRCRARECRQASHRRGWVAIPRSGGLRAALLAACDPPIVGGSCAPLPQAYRALGGLNIAYSARCARVCAPLARERPLVRARWIAR